MAQPTDCCTGRSARWGHDPTVRSATDTPQRTAPPGRAERPQNHQTASHEEPAGAAGCPERSRLLPINTTRTLCRIGPQSHNPAQGIGTRCQRPLAVPAGASRPVTGSLCPRAASLAALRQFTFRRLAANVPKGRISLHDSVLPHSRRITSANIPPLWSSRAMLTRSLALWRLEGGSPGKAQPKATAPGMPWA